MQVQRNDNLHLEVSAHQQLIDEIYVPQPSKISAKVLVLKTDINSQIAASNAEHNNEIKKTLFLRSLEAYGDCV